MILGLSVETIILSKILSKLGAKSLINVIGKIETGEANFKEQEHQEATYAKKISKNDAKITQGLSKWKPGAYQNDRETTQGSQNGSKIDGKSRFSRGCVFGAFLERPVAPNVQKIFLEMGYFWSHFGQKYLQWLLQKSKYLKVAPKSSRKVVKIDTEVTNFDIFD